ncbi:MAG: O-methyltransferase family 2 [Elusimicrobia bacterium]|nr:MAG: O-methyltransferase family 2 [Elusimicrobiota bacterium]
MSPKEKLVEPKGEVLPSPQKILDMVFGFTPTVALATAVRLDVFTVLSQGVSTVPELSKATGAGLRGLVMLLDFLVSLGLVEKQSGRYSVTPESESYLVRGKDTYVGGFLDLAPGMMQDWLRLGDTLKTGEPVRRVETQDASEEFFPPLIRALYVANMGAARNLARKLGIGTRWRGLRILDVAAGSGVFGIGALLEDPSSTVTALDYPRILNVTREFAAKAGVEDRLSYLEGSLREVPLEDNTFDLALLGNICHSEGEDASREFFRKLQPAMRAGGKVAVIDMVPNEERTGPPFPLLFALNMLLHTRQGGTFTQGEYTRWLQEAGFKKVEAVDIRSHSPAIVASK